MTNGILILKEKFKVVSFLGVNEKFNNFPNSILKQRSGENRKRNCFIILTVGFTCTVETFNETYFKARL